MFPVVFISTAFVPAELMPGWMQSVNDWNPVTYQIEAIRALMTAGLRLERDRQRPAGRRHRRRRPAVGHALGVPAAGEVGRRRPGAGEAAGPGRRSPAGGPCARTRERASCAAGGDAAGGTIRLMTDQPQRRDRLDDLRATLKRIPNEPGVYRFLDAAGRGALRGQGEGAAQARRQLPAPVGDAARAHRRDARAGRRARLGGDGDRVRGAPPRGQLHQGGAPAVQPPPARRQELPVHRGHAERRVAAGALLPRPPRARQPVLRPVLERAQGAGDAGAHRPHLPVPQVPRRASRAARAALPACSTSSSARSARATTAARARSTWPP